MSSLTGFQRDLLIAIAALDAAKGTAVKSELEEYYASEINHGRLYPNLDTLVDRGLVSKGSRDRRTNEYELTDRGEALLAQRREWEDKRVAEVTA